MIRALDGHAVFRDDRDRRDFVSRLSTILPESGMRCFGWALLSNHAHLLLQTGEVSLSGVMRRLNTGLAVRFNRLAERRGYVFQDRFKSRLVKGDADLLGLIRYVELNPLRAGLVPSLAALERYPWSGLGAALGCRPPLPFESVSAALALFAARRAEARARLRACLAEDWNRGGAALRDHPPIGGAAETPVDPGSLDHEAAPENRGVSASVDVVRPADPASALNTAIEVVAARFALRPDDLMGSGKAPRIVEARAALSYLAVAELRLSGVRVAARLGIRPSTVSQAMTRGRGIARALGLSRENVKI
jgi:REP element-mobilizing transposase RayT